VAEVPVIALADIPVGTAESVLKVTGAEYALEVVPQTDFTWNW
jgi:hypothetical protein